MSKTRLLTAILLSAWIYSATIQAEQTTWSFGTFGNFGMIDQLDQGSVFIDDMKFRISPTAKLSTADNDNANMELLKKGQMVGFTNIIINKRLLIDHIWLIPDNEHGLYRPQP